LRWRSPLVGFPFEPGALNPLANLSVVAQGVPGFFVPNPAAAWGAMVPLGAERAAYYDTAPLADTLCQHVDFQRIARGSMRLTVGAVNVESGRMRYFDSRDEPLDVRHVMASGALPPAFPAVRIDDELYWDGGIYSNTPIEAVLDDNPRRDALIFAVQLWNPSGAEPQSIWQVMGRQKDIQYASRADSHIARQKQIHRLRHVISELLQQVPAARRDEPAVRELAGWGCKTTMHIVRLLAPRLAAEDHTKDIDFTPAGIRARCDAGIADAEEVIAQAPWLQPVAPHEGVLVHDHLSSCSM
jgi:NTE family protein